MSRFGLRSASDVLKQSEEKPNRRKTCNASSISMKRNLQQKDSKFLTNINDENVIDDIKIEIEDVERVSDIVDGSLRNKNLNGGDNDDEDEDAEYVAQSLPFKGSLICSLPLERITDVIQKLNLSKSTFDTVVTPKQYLEKECDDVEESVDNDDDEEDDNNISKQSTAAVKNLCLYCDKKFSSHKMQLKHVEKFHCLQQDRRCSGRNSQVQQAQTPRKRKSNIGSQNFPGCTFCQKSKCLTQSIILPASDLSALFVHLADCHTDKYFGCKTCVLRFQNITKLSKHMEIVHKSLPFAFDESSCKSGDNDTGSLVSNEKPPIGERSKLSLKRQQRSQKNFPSGGSNNGTGFGSTSAAPQCSTTMTPNTSVIGAEEPILSRLGLTQNRLPNNRKGVRLRREKMIPEMLLKSEQNHTSSSSFVSTVPTSSTLSSTCSPKLRGKAIKVLGNFPGDTLPDVVFRVPTRNDILSCVFDDNFYKEVVANVRNNLLFHMDGKIMGTSSQSLDEAVMSHTPQPQIRSTLVKSPIVVTTMESEIHAATSLAAVTAFPTLLTAAQFGGDGSSSKLRRPHTKNSWKWKWDSVKKFKLVNEGGKIVKKMKHPMLGLRDLSKLDMWTQLTMRQKYELLQQQQQCPYSGEAPWSLPITEISNDPSREEKQRLNDQLNMILDMRLLPHIILEQNEQAIIKLENDEFGIAAFQAIAEDSRDNLMAQTFADESFLSMLNLLPNINSHNRRAKIVLSGEWARPRCYLCMCCGAKFEKLKSLEEHKMFRHSQILSTHYEVVGRELLNGNLLRHLFLPKKALSRYANEMGNQLVYSGAARRLFWHKNEVLAREITNNDESSDSLQSMINSCTTNSPSIKNSSSTEDCDIETKIATTTPLDLVTNNTVVSPTHSIQSCSSSSSTVLKSQMKMQNNSQLLAINASSSSGNGSGCSKCGRKCNGILDLYRHMLDCSGDYVWSLAKKRKYRYYCGSKKRRPCNKHSVLELRKTKPKAPIKTPTNANESTEEGGASTSGNFAKTKTSPRPRPSDAESIKKMLENLPAKRVCKKIFPALSKAKKNIKTIKPKLLSKHKIYNSLRKTRVRQMSQAAKILSKTKSQMNKSKKMTTRSSTTPSTGVGTNKIISTKNTLLNKTATKKPATKVSSTPKPEAPNELSEVVTKIKIENERDVEQLINEKDDKYTQADTSDKSTTFAETSAHSMNNADKQCTMADNRTADNISIPAGVEPNTCTKTSQNINQQESSKSGLADGEIENKRNTSNVGLSTCEADKNMPNNKNIKRSKRISDCIAMLTGKLEQKLKTEQKVSATQSGPTTNMETVANLSNQFPMNLFPATQQMKPNQTRSELELLEVSHDVVADRAAILKKTPKRKAISRRIIKTDDEETPDVSALSIDPHMGILSRVAPVNAKEHEVLPQINNVSIAKMDLPHQTLPKPIVAMAKSLAEPVLCQVEGNQMNIISSASLIPPMPSAIPLNNAKLISNVPLYLPVENLRPPHLGQLPLPLSLPVQVAGPLPLETITQPSAVAHPPAVATAGIGLFPPTAIPLITSVPPAHLPPPSVITLTATSFSIPAAPEPLNLSSSSKNVHKQSQDLSCSGRQRTSGIPTRRQTICGFEARNFAMFDEMEPLDLSKKSRLDISTPPAPLLPNSIELTPMLLPVQSPIPVSQPKIPPSDPTVLPVPPLTPEALLNKPFYSNLDLLRIPQVRNPVVGQVTTNPEQTSPPSTSVAMSNQQNTPIVSIVPIPAVKPPIKKRNKLPTAVVATASGNSVESVPSTTNNSSTKLNNSKDNTSSKKETSAKSKITLRMDEEVINHIDDAINSVINAVKASLDSEEAEKSQEICMNVLPKTTDDVNTAKESVVEFKYLTASRRNMRSKTLDCRPVAFNKSIRQSPPLVVHNPPTTAATTISNQIITVKNIETLNGLDPNNVSPQSANTTGGAMRSSQDVLETSENQRKGEKEFEESLGVAVTENQPAVLPPEQRNTFDIDSGKSNLQRKCDATESHNIVDTTKLNEIVQQPLETAKDNVNIPQIVPLSDTDGNIVNPTATNQTNLDVEQMSNNNNTSSGFHSSAQSDQQTSVMSTTTSVSASVIVSDTKKKQRRRRKNELAAIVADQLLESFKLDKVRRDNLKKLENLAYEKSEDLLLTGMLLMSSTKRNVNSTSTINPCATTTSSAADANEAGHHNKRANKTHQNSETSKPPSDIGEVEDKVIDRSVAENDKSTVESGEVSDGKKTNKRRQCRRRGKTLDNENISKLKSSLESFSIDIERQLSEYEAKNVNVFKNVSSNDTGKIATNAKTQNAVSSKPFVILRPSILSMTLEATANVDNSQTVKLSATNDTSKTVVSSRDPRLNKNIHKEGEKNSEAVTDDKVLPQKSQAGPEEIGDLEEDNYLTEIAKNVNEKIMSTENEEFAFKDDGFEMANEMGVDDSNSKFSRPPTSMSVRSAPNFNDDRSNFGSICDENTNTEVMDMDLDDEMSVYTSYSQDLGRGRGRRRRRRRSILLTRKPKKRTSSRDLSAEKIECILCKKVFYSANSLSKHNMTLAHVSKVSEQEYLLSKSLTNSIANVEPNQSCSTLGPYARRSTRRATISEPLAQLQSRIDTSLPPLPMPPATNVTLSITPSQSQIPPTQTTIKAFTSQEMSSAKREDLAQPLLIDAPKSSNTLHLPKDIQDNDFGGNNGTAISTAYNGNSRLNLNPDERLFFECCNILKSAETPRINSVIVPEQCNNLNVNYGGGYTIGQQDKLENAVNVACIRDRTNVTSVNNMDNLAARNSNIQAVRHVATNSNTHHNHQLPIEQSGLFRDPQSIITSNSFNKSGGENRTARSPTYSAISHLSAVTNTTSRFKTKAAMKGYENVNVDLMQQQESKSRTICKLTELAEIALGNEDKPNSHSFSPIQSSSTPPRPILQSVPCASKVDIVDSAMRVKGLPATDFATLLAADAPKEANIQMAGRNDRTKNNETRSSTSSKTIMHSSIIKAAVEEHQKVQNSSKIIIPERPFKNIGLEEKETITFQKPKAPAVHLLTEDNNSVSTGSFSDRDDYDFGSLSCDEDASVRESNDKNPKNNSSESSSESSRATAKTFENKSLIMGRIFKNVSTKAVVKNTVAAIKVKSVGVQKDQTPAPKADLNQLFDELRGNSGVDGTGIERTSNVGAIERGTMTVTSNRLNHKQHQRDTSKHIQQQPKHIAPAVSPPAIVSSTTATPSTSTRKTKTRESRAKPKAVGKTRKDISKLQYELGMSPDEIKKLIDEGQRKSKRRCATNRPKKLVEMWSSDEYEEFLSTKDIIALIEEKEQEEKRKKRKNSVNIFANSNEMAKEKETSDVTSSTKDIKRKNTRKAASHRCDILQYQDKTDCKFTKSRKSGGTRNEDPVSTTLGVSESMKIVPQKNGAKSSAVDSSNTAKTKRIASFNKTKTKKAAKAKSAKLDKESNRARRKKSLDGNDDVEDDECNESGKDDDEDFLIAGLKQRQNNKTRSKKASRSRTTTIAPTVTSTANIKLSKSLANPLSAQKRSSNNNSTNVNSANAPSATDPNTNAKSQKQSPQKGKRKNQTNQSPPRRKRPASEKLYYWSSSSDEDFGRINNNKNKAATDNFDNGGEQYQKHGWIVGDSHKKLVTLLAIAKGNKKVDVNSGVKKNVTKKRN